MTIHGRVKTIVIVDTNRGSKLMTHVTHLLRFQIASKPVQVHYDRWILYNSSESFHVLVNAVYYKLKFIRLKRKKTTTV